MVEGGREAQPSQQGGALIDLIDQGSEWLLVR